MAIATLAAATGCSDGTASATPEDVSVPDETTNDNAGCLDTSCGENEVCVESAGGAFACECSEGFHTTAEGCISDTTLTSCTPEALDCTETAPEGAIPTCDASEGCGFTCPESMCLIDGVCVEAGVEAPDAPCLECDPSQDASDWSARVGKACDDANLCTYDDVCQSDGACSGTTIDCTDNAAAGTCAPQSTCNGTAECTVDYPPAGTGCDDGDLCTFNDGCDGSGSCTGSTVDCTSDLGPCGAERSCNGTASCDVEFPAASVSCNDGDLCTFGDACNGAGGCTGIPIVCEDDASACGAVASCNGTSSCTLTYTDAGTECSDGNSCTQGDSCDGAGSCGSDTILDCGAHGSCGISGCVCDQGYTGDACRECDVGYVPDGEDCVAETSPLPDFALIDINTASDSFGDTIRFEDYRGRISAWYFFHST